MKRGKKYVEAAKAVDRATLYDTAEAISLVKKAAVAKFDETIEVHIRTGCDGRHADQQIRGAVVLPHGTGKTVKVLVFAKGTKATPGHFEVYLEENGELAFYAPELANNNPVKSGVILNDGENHAFAVTYDGSSMTFYIDGEATNTMEVSGTLSNKTTAFRIGQLVENGFGYTGTIRNIRLYNYALTEADALALSGGTGAEPDDNPDVPNIPTGDGASWAALAAVLLPAAMVLALRRRAKV